MFSDEFALLIEQESTSIVGQRKSENHFIDLLMPLPCSLPHAVASHAPRVVHLVPCHQCPIIVHRPVFHEQAFNFLNSNRLQLAAASVRPCCVEHFGRPFATALVGIFQVFLGEVHVQ